MVLFLSFMVCWLRFGLTRLRGPISPHQRAEWMQFCGRITLASMGIRYRVEGPLPNGPTLIVANHLSYLDIAICSAALPCAFVAKSEIASWPAFGFLARLGGTIFVDRGSRLSAWDTAESMGLRLDSGVPVLLFPEGTSTDGSEVQRFHSTLFAPAIEAGLAVIPAAIFYEPWTADIAESHFCWFGDESFFPHLMRVLGTERFTAVVRFGDAEVFPDRRTAAWRSHDAVQRLREKERRDASYEFATKRRVA
ncbi:lysophospholipid acyltransferase family protein [Acidicapsa ligni]|uniref:lysophospholipid acyltransferase family protein n=1 Tax=Acidicapsa ligni TaxID=542300 RepID=UPI0021E0945B|nr:lysophospholipid acyltransferase family protein [Acidicapsa ligni]